MKRKINSLFSLFLVLALLTGVLPVSVFAANDEYVLTSINHSSAVSVVDLTGSHTATFTLPYSNSGSINFSSGLDISYDTNVYASVSASFLSGSVATVGGEPVVMTVTYLKKNDTTPCTVQYNLYVVRAVAKEPTFTGTISKVIKVPDILTFTEDDFTGLYNKYDGGALASIVITGSNPTFGSLKWGNSYYTFGTAVSLSELKAGILTFSATAAGTVSYIVKAYAAGDTSTQIGSVILTITAEENDAGEVVYKTVKNTPVEFDGEDFSNAFHDVTGEDLFYVIFTLPSKSYGKLYYNYSSATEYDSIVYSDTKYYVNKSPLLSNITFVPAANYIGPVEIAFLAYNADGDEYDGKLKINVSDTQDEVSNVTYTTDENTVVSFNASQFNIVCEAVTGETLSYVYFTIPSSSSGKLYYKYTSASDYESIVAQTTKYFRNDSPCIGNIDFVPAEDFSGIVPITYTAYSIGDSTYTGKIMITVEEAEEEEEEESEHFNDVGRGHMWAVRAINYLYNNGIIKGDGKGHYNPNASISRGDFILMLCRAFNLNADTKGNFSDVEEGSYYSDAIATAKHLKIAKGSGGKFNPKASLSRQDAMVLIVRAMEAAGLSVPTGDMDDLAAFSDSNKISNYAVEAIATLVKAGIIEGSNNKLNPKANVSRAEMAVILYRVLTD